VPLSAVLDDERRQWMKRSKFSEDVDRKHQWIGNISG
jgi:hypothetical protein